MTKKMPKGICFWKNQKGVTLIEIIVTLVVIGIAVPAIMIPFSGLNDSKKPEIAVQATYLANRQMEALADRKFDDLPASSAPHSTCANFVANGLGLGNINCSVAGFTDYTFSWLVEDVSAASPGGAALGSANFAKRVTLTVTHTPTNEAFDFFFLVTD
ncbi:MAG: hypothetical protein COV66_06260 [Nitrospinae bacterium CG11_big_fil_rev_8_21_14_0_20_45_15]|nr:MAG: hypothetical protein COV66_06260 [Nitrospinae bacterium CG11_big_fil_rev_8_21_14_0_20_45_15]